MVLYGWYLYGKGAREQRYVSLCPYFPGEYVAGLNVDWRTIHKAFLVSLPVHLIQTPTQGLTSRTSREQKKKKKRRKEKKKTWLTFSFPSPLCQRARPREDVVPHPPHPRAAGRGGP